jgi:hypothetical protein
MSSTAAPTLPPLTHHDILRLVEPFARAGCSVDMAATDRTARRISFRASDIAIDATPAQSWTCWLELDNRHECYFVVRRVLLHPDGPRAELEADGKDPAALLVRVQSVPPSRHVSAGPGWLTVRSYDTEVPRGQRVPAGQAGGIEGLPLVMTQAEVIVQGLTLNIRIKLPNLRGVPGDLTLTPTAGTRPSLPEDLLAVQGWDWARLEPNAQGWTSKLRLRGAVLRRSRTAERALEQVGAHLARVLAEPPIQFHDRHRWARWGVVLRRGIPSLTVVLMIGGALSLPRWIDPAKAGLWMALHYLPIALLALAFKAQELSRFEIPPLPRRACEPSWNEGKGGEDLKTAAKV